VGELRAGAVSFFSAFDPPVLPPYPRLARADKMPGMGRAMRRLARFVSRKWPQPIYDLRANWDCRAGQESAVRREALAVPGAGAVFAGAGHGAEGLAGEYADYGILLLRCGRGNAALPEQLEKFLAAGDAPVVFTLGSAAVLAAGGFMSSQRRRRRSWACARCC
jgi:rhamnosyltransferase subunit B